MEFDPSSNLSSSFHVGADIFCYCLTFLHFPMYDIYQGSIKQSLPLKPILFARLSNSLQGPDDLLFSEFRNIVSIFVL